MTEQRFTIVRDEYNKSKGIFDNITQKEVFQWSHIARMLNILNNRYIRQVTELKKENEQLKQTLRTYRKVANCSNCDYHDYDCRVDGDDFEVCDRGNDMSDYICEDWREL